MTTHVAQQVERILDEDSEPTVGVLVQVAEPGPAAAPLDDAMVRGARELLPGAVPEAAGGIGVESLRQSNQDALASLMDSEPARNSRAATTYWTSRTAYLELARDDVARLRTEAPGVVAVFPNAPVTLPPVSTTDAVPTAIAENSTASYGITQTGALSVWGAYGARGKGVTVGVLDTGVDAEHPDLAGKVSAWAEFDGEGNRVDSAPHDSGTHGTHVCGTIVGGNASGQWIGMAPEAKVAVGLVLKGGSGTTKQVLAGIDWAVDQGVDVLSLSLAATVFTADAPTAYTAAFVNCRRMGIPVVAAVGNHGTQTGATTGSDVFALGVGATDHRDVIAGFSGGHTQRITTSLFIAADKLPHIYTKPDLSAPGFAVVSAIPGGRYEAKNGTSMATPHVAGAVALLLSAVPSIRSLEGEKRVLFISKQLIGSVDELGEAGKDSRFGFGRLNVLRAIALAKAGS
jgi:subtilisin family serine protease